MTRRHLPAACTGLLLLSGVGLSGCASAPTRFFTLDAVGPSQTPPGGYVGPPVKVLAVNIPPALDREELVSEVSPGVVKVHDFEHWEAPLGLTARQTLVEDLAARLPAGRVLGPSSPGGAGVATLSVDVVSFRSGPEGATMQASWSAALPASAAGVSTGVVRAPLQQLQSSGAFDDGDGTARAFSDLLGQLSDQIASTLPERLQAAVELQAEVAAAAAAAQARTQSQTQSHTRVTTRSTAQPF